MRPRAPDGVLATTRWTSRRSVVRASTGPIAAALRKPSAMTRSRTVLPTMMTSGTRNATATRPVTANEIPARDRLTRGPPRSASRGRAQAHPDAADGVEVARLARGLAELAAQPREVDVDRLVLAVRLLPDLREELAARDDPVRPGGEVREQVELAAGQLQRLAGQRRRPPGRVDDEVADGVDRVGRRALRA